EHGNGDRRDNCAVAPNEFARAIAERVLARDHRAAFEVAADVAGELLDRAIAALDLFLQSAQHDDVEIAGERAMEAARRRVARGGNVGGRGLAVALANDRRRRPRLLLEDRPLDLGVTVAGDVVRAAAGKEAVEENA